MGPLYALTLTHSNSVRHPKSGMLLLISLRVFTITEHLETLIILKLLLVKKQILILLTYFKLLISGHVQSREAKSLLMLGLIAVPLKLIITLTFMHH